MSGRHRCPASAESSAGRGPFATAGAVLTAAWLVLTTGTAPTATAGGSSAAPRARHDEAARYDPPAPVVPASLRAVRAALSKLGAPYVWGAKGENGAFDCSGLIQWSYRQAGVALGPDTYSQIREGVPVPRAQAGDIVFPANELGLRGPGHVVLAISESQAVEAPGRGMSVRVIPLPSGPIRRVA